MRCSLPLDEPSTLAWRPFRPGQDEEAWVRVNNRSFADHPDQGQQTVATLETQEREPWFDPEGFVLYEEDDELLGFCWTKVHRDHAPPLGEIYVIGVDPDAHGRGLGRGLVLAGLDWLHRAGLEVGMLYVDADNEPAVGLYRSLGFEPVQRDVYFTGVLERSQPEPGEAFLADDRDDAAEV
jgi:mycothiol synthase